MYYKSTQAQNLIYEYFKQFPNNEPIFIDNKKLLWDFVQEITEDLRDLNKKLNTRLERLYLKNRKQKYENLSSIQRM